MLHGLLWLPLLLIFILLTALGWLERRRQNLFRNWANGSEICKLDSSGAALLKDGELKWSAFEAGIFEEKDSFKIKKLELVELMALTSGEAYWSCRARIFPSVAKKLLFRLEDPKKIFLLYLGIF